MGLQSDGIVTGPFFVFFCFFLFCSLPYGWGWVKQAGATAPTADWPYVKTPGPLPLSLSALGCRDLSPGIHGQGPTPSLQHVTVVCPLFISNLLWLRHARATAPATGVFWFCFCFVFSQTGGACPFLTDRWTVGLLFLID